jgi:hypothetical protein
MEALLWIAFTAMFAFLAFHHWKLSGMSVKSIQHHGMTGLNLPDSNRFCGF